MYRVTHNSLPPPPTKCVHVRARAFCALIFCGADMASTETLQTLQSSGLPLGKHFDGISGKFSFDSLPEARACTGD